MTSNAASKTTPRVDRLAPIAANWAAPPPTAHCITSGPRAMAASVARCSAASTGCHSGRRNRAPAVRSPHSASSRPSIGVLCRYCGTEWWSPTNSESSPASRAAAARSIM
jgi:hypothetical protein